MIDLVISEKKETSLSVDKIDRVTTLVTLPSGEIRLESGADGLYILFDADCLDALPYCKGQCCSLTGILISPDEAESFAPKYPIEFNDRFNSYEMRRDSDGACACQDRQTRQCSIYEERPRTCQQFHCTRGAYQRGFRLETKVSRLSGYY